MKYFVTGATGFVGGHVAGWYEVGATDPSPGERINVEGTRNVLTVMDELDVPKGVYTSTLAVNSDTNGQVVDESYRYAGSHLTAYDRTKWEAHYEVAEPMVEAGLPLVTVMPGLVYGPGDTSVFGDALRDFLRGDLPTIPREVAYSPGHVADVAGRDPPRAISPAVFGALAPVAGLLERVVTIPKGYRAESLRVLGGVTYLGDNSKARAELGLEHRPLREGLEETVNHELARLSG